MSRTKLKIQEKVIRKEEAREELKQIISKDTKFVCSIPHVARSGMTRHIKIYIVSDDGYLLNYSLPISELLEERYNEKNCALVVYGCGMDMVFKVLYDLSHTLFNDGYVLSKSKNYQLI